MTDLLQDAALAIRSLRRSRAFVITTVLSLGIALGVATTMFGIVDTALNPAVPLRDASRVVSITNSGDGAGHSAPRMDISDGARKAPGLFEDATAVGVRSSFLRIGQHYDRQLVLTVSPNFFSTTGIEPFLGNSLGQASESSEQMAMVSFRLWRSALGGRRELTAATVDVDGTVYRIVGVLPPYMPAGLNAGVMVSEHQSASGASPGFAVTVGRLREHVTATQAESTLRAVVDPVLTASHGVGRHPFRYGVRPVVSDRPEEMSNLQRILLGSAFIILVIACANLANLMLARGLARERDFALSLALGARRINLVRQTLFQGLACALGGAALGVLIAMWAFDAVTYQMARDVPGLGALAVSLNWRAFAFSVGAATVTSLVFSLFPALRTSGVDLSLPLKSGAGTTTGRVRTRFSALIVAEVALTMTLMLGAGLLMKAVQSMRTTELGYNPRGLLSIETYVARTQGRSAAVSAGDMAGLLATIQRQPGVRHAALEGTGTTPRTGPGLVSALEGGGNRRLFSQRFTTVSADYLKTLGISIAAGRDFVSGDEDSRGAVIVNETAARLLWPSESPVGRMLKLGDLETDAPWVPVVGVARNVHPISTVMSVDTPGPQLWVVPPNGAPPTLNRVRVRVAAAGEGVMRTALDRISRQTLTPGSIVVVSSALDAFDDAVLARDFVAKLFAVFGAIALGLAALGLYCLLAFTVAERRRELAVRVALGASSVTIGRLVARDALVMVLAGTGVGAFAAMGLARALDALLYDVFYTDVGALLAAEAIVILVSMAAAVVPARRAMQSDPVEVLRSV